MAAVLFTAEANTQVKNHTSSTSLPCTWLPPSFQSVPCMQVSDMDFTTPRYKEKPLSMNRMMILLTQMRMIMMVSLQQLSVILAQPAI